MVQAPAQADVLCLFCSELLHTFGQFWKPTRFSFYVFFVGKRASVCVVLKWHIAIELDFTVFVHVIRYQIRVYFYRDITLLKRDIGESIQ